MMAILLGILMALCVIGAHADLQVCTLPLQIGPCRALFPRFFYNVSSCKCESFGWGGCDPNGNNFVTMDACISTCEVPMKTNPACTKPKQPGLCKAYMPRWWYNSTSCQCEQFIYGGCGANENNFLNQEYCNTNCRCYECDICKLPIQTQGPGPIACLAYIPSWGFNATSCRCEYFIYSGCGGNSNRFPTLEECNSHCGSTPCESQVSCSLPANVGPCEAAVPRFFYNTKTCQCEKFIWGGCGGNSNNFQTLLDCQNACGGSSTCEEVEAPNCVLPKDSGPCEALMKRFYYDPLNCKCRNFNYGGCQGNSNNFITRRTCNQVCKDTKCPVCNLPKEPGPCRGSFKRFFFNIQTCQCEPFIYGGCGGNGNNYDTIETCQAVCGSVLCPVCNLPKSKGPCTANLERWYFDAAECQCKPFTYGGCKGNMNRFITKEDCEGACGSYPCPVCSQPMKVGPCRAAINRWYYNATANECQAFSWGGCDPNGNNFKTRRQCNQVCKNFVG